MKSIEKYSAPSLEVLSLKVEQGFASSDLTSGNALVDDIPWEEF